MEPLAATVDTPGALQALRDRLLRTRRMAHLITELDNSGMPNAQAVVAAFDWTTILAWIEKLAPAISALISALVALLGGL